MNENVIRDVCLVPVNYREESVEEDLNEKMMEVLLFARFTLSSPL